MQYEVRYHQEPHLLSRTVEVLRHPHRLCTNHTSLMSSIPDTRIPLAPCHSTLGDSCTLLPIELGEHIHYTILCRIVHIVYDRGRTGF